MFTAVNTGLATTANSLKYFVCQSEFRDPSWSWIFNNLRNHVRSHFSLQILISRVCGILLIVSPSSYRLVRRVVNALVHLNNLLINIIDKNRNWLNKVYLKLVNK